MCHPVVLTVNCDLTFERLTGCPVQRPRLLPTSAKAAPEEAAVALVAFQAAAAAEALAAAAPGAVEEVLAAAAAWLEDLRVRQVIHYQVTGVLAVLFC